MRSASLFRVSERHTKPPGPRPRSTSVGDAGDPAAASTPASAARGGNRGITLLELLISMGIIGLLAAIGANLYMNALVRARVTRTIGDVRAMERILSSLEIQGGLPGTLDEMGWTQQDPWGRDYRFVNFALEDPTSLDKTDGKPRNARRDKFLKPLNSTYDLYSLGADGETKPSLNHKTSLDDVVRAADGAYVGVGSGF